MRFALTLTLFGLIASCAEPTSLTGDVWIELVFAQGRAELTRSYPVGAQQTSEPRVVERAQGSLLWDFRDGSGALLANGIVPDTRIAFVEGTATETSAELVGEAGTLALRIPNVAGTLSLRGATGEVASLRYQPITAEFSLAGEVGKGDFAVESDLVGDLVRVAGDEGQTGFTLLFVSEGYVDEELPDFSSDVDALLGGLHAVPEFAAHRDSLHVFRQAIRSRESGLSDTDQKRDTAFNVAVGDGRNRPRRCFLPSADWSATSAANLSLLRQTSKADIVIVVANTAEQGGCANFAEKYLVVSPSGAQPGRTLAHELGHALFGLADEYAESGRACRTAAPNLTASLDRTAIPWGDRIAESTTLPTTTTLIGVVGAFEGGGYCAEGVYRPAHRCLMRDTNDAFCPVCGNEIERAFASRESSLQSARITNRTSHDIWLICGVDTLAACGEWQKVSPSQTIELPLREGRFRLQGPRWNGFAFRAPTAAFGIFDADDPFHPASIVDTSLVSDGGVVGGDVSCFPVISEVQTAGLSSDDEFVEVFNPCVQSVSLDGLALRFSGASERLALNGQLARGEHRVFGGRGLALPAVERLPFEVAEDSGALDLVRGEFVLDALAWGEIDAGEGHPAIAPYPGASLARIPDGQDTGDNQRDFLIRRVPTPGTGARF